jgi:hypothetical protein
MDGFDNKGGVHFMDFEALPDRAKQRDCKLSPQMFAEFVEAGQDAQIVCGISKKQLGRE